MQVLPYVIVLAFAAFVVWINILYRQRRAGLTERERANEDRNEWVDNIW